MRRGAKVLLLAGSAEADALAAQAMAWGIDLTVLVSERPRMPGAASATLFDFAKLTALAELMHPVDAVVDASHGFDALATEAGHKIAGDLGKPFLAVSRPPCSVTENPLWQGAPGVETAVSLITPGIRVFAATGWPSLASFAAFPGERLMVRQTVPHNRVAPFPFMEFVFGTPPFTVWSEKLLFETLGIDLLICRNLGGQRSRSKLDAAIERKMPVILIDKPPLQERIHTVTDASAALAWLEGVL
jgi:precorrin-6A/cobalt-precorrin-6A reductase